MRGCCELGDSSEVINEEYTFEKLDPDEVTTEWNDSYLFSSREEALEELEILKKKPEEINKTFRPQFENLSGPVLLDFLNAEKEFAKSLEVLYVYAYTQFSKNVSDPFFVSLLTDSQNLVTEYGKVNSFTVVKLTSLNDEEWNKLFSEEPELEEYRPYLEAKYRRFADHRAMNESQAVYIAELENQRMNWKLRRCRR